MNYFISCYHSPSAGALSGVPVRADDLVRYSPYVLPPSRCSFTYARACLIIDAREAGVLSENEPVHLHHEPSSSSDIIPVEHAHVVREVDRQLDESGHSTIPVIPWSLMKQLVLPVTDDLIRIGHTCLHHVAYHLTGFLSVAIIQILARHIPVAPDRTLILIEDYSLSVAHRCGEIYCVKIAELLFHIILNLS